MADNENPKPTVRPPPPPSDSKIAGDLGRKKYSNGGYRNPPDAGNPDPATLREQWKFAVRQYSRWYSHAWGTAILAGVSFFALGWIIKGSNPLPSFNRESDSNNSRGSGSASPDTGDRRKT